MSNIIFKPFVKSAAIQEAEDKGSDRIRILIKASTDDVDLDGDRFLSDAWLHPDDKDFYMKKGVIDYNHLSKLLAIKKGSPDIIAKAQKERIRAIIGEPVDLDVDSNALYCKADVYKTNFYVSDMVPALKAGTSRYGASIGGGAYPPSEVTKSEYGEKVYDRARLDHIALCPLLDARNPHTHVELLKSISASLNGIEIDGGEETPVAKASPSSMDQIFRDYCMGREDFQEHVYETVKSRYGSNEIPDHPGMVEFFKSMGLDEAVAIETATLAVIHFAGQGDAS